MSPRVARGGTEPLHALQSRILERHTYNMRSRFLGCIHTTIPAPIFSRVLLSHVYDRSPGLRCSCRNKNSRILRLCGSAIHAESVTKPGSLAKSLRRCGFDAERHFKVRTSTNVAVVDPISPLQQSALRVHRFNMHQPRKWRAWPLPIVLSLSLTNEVQVRCHGQVYIVLSITQGVHTRYVGLRPARGLL